MPHVRQALVLFSLILFATITIAPYPSTAANQASTKKCMQCRSCGKLFELKGDFPDACPACGYKAVVGGGETYTVTSWGRIVDCGDKKADTVSQTPPGRKLPLCDEAFKFFGTHELESLQFLKTCNIRKGYIEILADFEKAIGTYDEKYKSEGNKAFVSAPRLGGFRAINWVGNEGGMLPDWLGGRGFAQQFVFENPEDVVHDIGRPDRAKRGTEPALYRAIIDDSESKKRPLTLGEIFYLALEQRGGDAREAMLLAHNTLRSVARGTYVVDRISDPELTAVRRDDAFFEKYVEVIRDDHPHVKALRDKGGPVYHIFGSAFFEMQMQGDLGPLPSLLAAYDLITESDAKQATASPSNEKQEETEPSLTPSILEAAIEQWYKPETAASRVANAYEQFLRMRGEKPNDPEKYCFNIWAARMGARLWERLGGSVFTSPWGSIGAPQADIPSSGFMGFNPAPPEIPKILKPLVEIHKSPVSVAWESGGKSMLFDQDSQSLHGYFPGVVILPFYERDSQTWGAISFDFTRQPHRKTYRATANGDVHILRIDMATRQASMHAMQVTRGEIYTMNVGSDPISSKLTRADGKSIEPVLISLPATQDASSAAVARKLFDNGNVYAIEAGVPSRPTTFTFTEARVITMIQNYHWNSGRGAAAGEIWLVDKQGRKYGPWKAKGFSGSGGAPNVYWRAYPKTSLGPGTYTLMDSDPSSWSQNAGSRGAGMTLIEGY